ncbi:outer membrane beta-barrel protein [Helicobacter equorum]|uniref:OMP950 n=1 Tax=Helicobacter equorum TaxID=361872 RepID=A0A1M4NGQ3_9HELI|nr:outer membrane beta-barrel protein [Helicobacter equorum]SFZ71366.1 OMP950 [Helicobacter equorum]
METRKLALSLAFMAMFSSITYAETTDEEIARLKKENELLELQQKNVNLIDKSGFLGFCKGEYANTGCFIGVEVGYAPGVKNYIFSNNTSESGSGTQSTYAIPINLILGWQVYSAKNWGWNFKAFFGYAGYGSDITVKNSTYTLTAKFNSSALHYGIEASYLYDFIVSQHHTFGMNVGIGYELGTFIGQSLAAATEEGSINLDSYTKTSFISSIGVHYFLNAHHQFWLTYKYKSGYNVGDGGSMNIDGRPLKYSSTPNNVLTFAYAYKF